MSKIGGKRRAFVPATQHTKPRGFCQTPAVAAFGRLKIALIFRLLCRRRLRRRRQSEGCAPPVLLAAAARPGLRAKIKGVIRLVKAEALHDAARVSRPRVGGGLAEKLRELLSNLILSARVGCLHGRMGRPYTVDGMTFRACADCGARRLFDLDGWRMYGGYFFRLPPAAGAAAYPARRPTRAGDVSARRLLQQAA